MQQVGELEIVSAPLPGDIEQRRWYAHCGETCLVLTWRGKLLEPFPTFGPSSYRVLAREVSLDQANAYALRHGFPHLRNYV